MLDAPVLQLILPGIAVVASIRSRRRDPTRCRPHHPSRLQYQRRDQQARQARPQLRTLVCATCSPLRRKMREQRP